MKHILIFLCMLLVSPPIYSTEEPSSSPAIRNIDAQIAAEQAKGDKADRNMLAWLQAKRQQLMPPGPSADELHAERQRAEQQEQERWQQQLQAGAEFTRELAKQNAARDAARSRNFAARQQQDMEARKSQKPQDSSLYITGYPYFWSFGPHRPIRHHHQEHRGHWPRR